MSKLQAISLGIVLGMLLAIIRLCAIADADIADMNAKLTNIEVAMAMPVKEQFNKDAEAIFLEYEEIVEEPEEMPRAPYASIKLEDEYQIFLEEVCEEYGCDFFLATALMESESTYNIDAEGDGGRSIGLMQINKCWWDAMDEMGLDVVTSPKDNIEAGVYILSGYLKNYEPVAAVQMYKCGERAGLKLLTQGEILEQCKEVISRAEQIKKETQNQ